MTQQEKQVRKLIKEFINQIDNTIKIKKGKEFYALLETNEINVVYKEFIKPKKEDKYHIQVLQEKGYNLDIGINVFYLLHELGHIKTYKAYGKNKQKVLQDYYNKINELKEKSFVKRLRLYKNIKMERDADLFAYLFYKNFYKMVKDFDNKLKELSK
jgi:transposase